MSTIAWLVPKLIEGSGGHRTILQNADFLQQRGYVTTLYLESNPGGAHRETPSDLIKRLFGYSFADVRVGWGEVKPCDMVFATIWYSAKLVRDLPFQCRRLYFVQDWEALFNPVGDSYLMAENSFRYGLIPITIGNWLRHEIKSRFEVSSFAFDFCADTSIYRPLKNVTRELAVCFICQPEKPRRAPVLGLEALGMVKHLMPSVRIYLYGSHSAVDAWFDHESLGLLRLDECNALYNRCTAGLCISASNPSRIPFEMMAAGLPVVELYRANTLYDLPGNACLLCDQTPESLAEGMLQVLRDEVRQREMGDAGVSYMQERTIKHGMNQFLEAVRWIENMPSMASMPTTTVQPIYAAPPVTASPFMDTLPRNLAGKRRPGQKARAGKRGLGHFLRKVFTSHAGMGGAGR